MDNQQKLEKLKHQYDLFFKKEVTVEPQKQRSDLKREIAKVKPALLVRTEYKFRFQQIVNSFATYCDLWDRQLKKLLEEE